VETFEMTPSSFAGPRRAVLFAGACLAAGLCLSQPAAAGSYRQTNLVTDDQAELKTLGFAKAKTQDKALKNPWGLASSASGPWWVSNQGSGTSTIYGGDGSKKPLVVAVPQIADGSPANPAGVTGQVAGANGGFVFANLDGSISAWTGGTNATQVVASREGGHLAVYTGLAEGVAAGGAAQYYAANEATGKVDVFSTGFAAVATAGGFVDPSLPKGFVPFDTQNIGGQIWVTYAVPGPAADAQPLGSGFVDVFDTDGHFVRRFASGGQLSSPWGLTRAPSGFGEFGGDMLIGNFNSAGLAVINAYDYDTGAFEGTLGHNGKDFVLPGLWALQFGNGGAAGDKNTLYFTAGPGDHEQHGLFGSISAVPEPAAWALMIAGFGFVGQSIRGQRLRRNRRALSTAVSPSL
jgi:uncharacterized protein (TIGR03118 family)